MPTQRNDSTNKTSSARNRYSSVLLIFLSSVKNSKTRRYTIRAYSPFSKAKSACKRGSEIKCYITHGAISSHWIDELFLALRELIRGGGVCIRNIYTSAYHERVCASVSWSAWVIGLFNLSTLTRFQTSALCLKLSSFLERTVKRDSLPAHYFRTCWICFETKSFQTKGHLRIKIE